MNFAVMIGVNMEKCRSLLKRNISYAAITLEKHRESLLTSEVKLKTKKSPIANTLHRNPVEDSGNINQNNSKDFKFNNI